MQRCSVLCEPRRRWCCCWLSLLPLLRFVLISTHVFSERDFLTRVMHFFFFRVGFIPHFSVFYDADADDGLVARRLTEESSQLLLLQHSVSRAAHAGCTPRPHIGVTSLFLAPAKHHHQSHRPLFCARGAAVQSAGFFLNGIKRVYDRI